MVVTFDDLLKQVKKQEFFSNIRFYFIYKNKHYFINNGQMTQGFSPKITVIKNRDSILSVFSKMEFLFDEIIRMRIIGYSNEKNNDELLYVLNLIPLNRKIRTFLDWKVFSPEFTRDMSRLFEVRNALIHAVSVNEVNYIPNKIVSLSSQTGFKKFKTYLEKSWNKLLQIYLVQQKPIFSQIEKYLSIIDF